MLRVKEFVLLSHDEGDSVVFQLLASCAWVASVIVYGSYESGDILQLLAAVCWTLSNVVAMPEAILPLLAKSL